MKRGDNSKRLLTLFSGYTITASQSDEGNKKCETYHHILAFDQCCDMEHHIKCEISSPRTVRKCRKFEDKAQ